MDCELTEWKVLATYKVESELSEFVRYLIYEKMSRQAASAVVDDYEDTLKQLKRVAGSLKYIDNQRLAELGYRRINFLRHRYYLIYRVNGDTAVVDGMYHELQDPDNIMR